MMRLSIMDREPIDVVRLALDHLDRGPIGIEPIEAGPIDIEPIDTGPIDLGLIHQGLIQIEPYLSRVYLSIQSLSI